MAAACGQNPRGRTMEMELPPGITAEMVVGTRGPLPVPCGAI
jgi:hypothetical protein